jgi:hypothetical protein
MNNEIIEKVEAILMQLERVETKLDNVIKAMHDYDSNEEYGESSFEAFMDTQAKSNLVGPCRGHDAASWDEEEAELNKRMDIIGQNGNEGTHYVTNEEADEDAFNDYGQRVVGDSNDIQDERVVGDKDKHTGEEKKRSKRRYYKPKNK